MPMVTSTKASGLMIRLMGKEFTHMQMELITKEIGSMINSMVLEKSHGPMVLNMKVNIRKEKKKEMEN
jgi:hypothetical protein